MYSAMLLCALKRTSTKM